MIEAAPYTVRCLAGRARWVLSPTMVALTVTTSFCGGCKSAAGAGLTEKSERSPLSRGKGAPWTILCMEISGPTREEQIGQIAGALKQTPGIRSQDVLINNDPDGFSRLYYGTYYRRTERKTRKQSVPAELQRNLDTIRQLGASDIYYFRNARIVRRPMPDVGNPQWMLVRAAGVYTLQVAAYEPTDEFWEHKQAAAEHCAFLREKGYEAYYHHGPGLSMVTVGSFGKDAVITTAVQEGGQTVYREQYGRDVLALQNDELLKYNLVNGAIVRVRTQGGQSVRVPSRLVHIPRPTEPQSWPKPPS